MLKLGYIPEFGYHSSAFHYFGKHLTVLNLGPELNPLSYIYYLLVWDGLPKDNQSCKIIISVTLFSMAPGKHVHVKQNAISRFNFDFTVFRMYGNALLQHQRCCRHYSRLRIMRGVWFKFTGTMLLLPVIPPLINPTPESSYETRKCTPATLSLVLWTFSSISLIWYNNHLLVINSIFLGQTPVQGFLHILWNSHDTKTSACNCRTNVELCGKLLIVQFAPVG